MKILILSFIGALFLYSLPAHADVRHQLWDQVKKGEVFILIRHALAPGTGDPSNFKLDDCSTQRNLNGQGRIQARTIGQIFRDQGLGDVEVFTSQWCRTKETAQEMALGKITELPSINSFYQNFRSRDQQTQDTINWLVDRVGKEPSVLVTHQVNITALTSVFPQSGDLVFAQFDRFGEIEVVGNLKTR